MNPKSDTYGGTGEFYSPVLDEAVALYLHRQGMSQEEFARETMGTSSNTFSWKRRGIREFTVSELSRLADVLGMSMDELAGRGPSREAAEAVGV